MTVTLLIIIVTGLVSYQAFNNRNIFEKLKHHPYIEHRSKEFFRLLSAGFLHGSMMHLAINMYVLYGFGQYVESKFLLTFGQIEGRAYYLLFYLIGILAGCAPTFFKHKNNPGFSSIGASGAVSSILLAYVYFDPWGTLLLFFVIPIPAIVFAVLYIVYSSFAGNNADSRIDHLGHFGGAVWGVIGIIALMYSRFDVFIQQLMMGPDFSSF